MLNKKLEEITADLIEIPSTTRKEKAISDYVQKCLSEIGMDFTKIGNNIVCDINTGKEKTIALVGHLDTVPETRKDQTKAEFMGEELFGLGACDMKSGLACMLKTAYEISKKETNPTKNIRLIFYDKEEGPLPNGLNRLLYRGMFKGIDFAFVLEPTHGEYNVGCLGSLTGIVDVQGKSSHSALAWKGINAIGLAKRVIENVESYGNRPIKVSGYDITETMNVTQISTSNAHNVIPSSCKLTVNYRFAPGSSIQDAEEIVKCAVGQDVKFIDESPACYVSSNICDYLRRDIKKSIMQGWADIAQLNAVSIPAVNYGPGNMNLAHTSEEKISIRELNEFYNSLKGHI